MLLILDESGMLFKNFMHPCHYLQAKLLVITICLYYKLDLYSFWTKWQSIHILNIINSAILYNLFTYKNYSPPFCWMLS